ncbi:MAG: hypothetical protein LC803_10380 [Acidobacteria bacterium]|nr:hypothetical protein [Acidobacteriota bacterium]
MKKKTQIPATLKRLGQMIVRCLGCGVAWVVSGLRPGDTHICKECGRRSVIERRPASLSPSNQAFVNS